MLHVDIKQAVEPCRCLLHSGRGVLVVVVTGQVKLFIMVGWYAFSISFIHFTGIAAADRAGMV